MKKKFFFAIILIPLLGSCQEKEAYFFLIHPGDKFEIKNECKAVKIDHGNPNFARIDTVRAELKVNNDPVREIHFAKAKLVSDTLLIVISSTTSAYHQEYRIKIINGKCNVGYAFRPTGPDYEAQVTPVEYLVIINTGDFKKGKEIRGHTEFKGKCKGEGCYEERDFEISGNFNAIIDL